MALTRPRSPAWRVPSDAPLRAGTVPPRKRVATTLLAVMAAASVAPHAPVSPLAAQSALPERSGTIAAPQGGWIGIRVALSPAAPTSGSRGFSVLVTGVFQGGPADRAGLLEGDRIVGVNGSALANYGMWMSTLDQAAPGQSVRFTVERQGGERDVSLVTDPRPPSVGPALDVARIASERAYMARVMDSVFNAVWRMAMGDTIALLWGSASERLRTLERMLDRPHPATVLAQRRSALRPSAVVEEVQPQVVTALVDVPSVGSSELPGPHGQLGESRFPQLARYLVGEQVIVGGALVRDLNDPLARYFGVSEGILVVQVLGRGPALNAGIRAGDVITSVADQPARTVSQLHRILAKAALPVDVVVMRRGQRRTLPYPAR